MPQGTAKLCATQVGSYPQTKSARSHWQETRIGASRPLQVLVASSNSQQRRQLVAQLQSTFGVASVSSGAEIKRALQRADIQVLVVGSTLSDVHAMDLACAVIERGLCSVICASEQTAPPSAFYRLGSHTSDADVRAIVGSAVEHRKAWLARREKAKEAPLQRLQQAEELQRQGEQARCIALQRTPREAAHVAVASIAKLVDVDRAAFLYYDAGSGTLWSEAGAACDDYEGAAANGLAGFAARTGAGMSVARAAADPRYCQALDNRCGSDDDRLALQPVITDGGHLHGVLIAARAAMSREFSASECETLRQFAERCAPVFDAFALQAEAAEVQAHEAQAQAPSLYRSAALEAYSQGRSHGEVVRVAATWTQLVYWILAAMALVAASYSWFARIGEYATGAALVVSRDRVVVNAKLSGTLQKLHVGQGSVVRKGDLLASFYDPGDAAALASLETQFNLELVKRLRDPSDAAIAQSMANIAGARARAQARIEERRLRAPGDGVVSDVRARKGQLVEAGQAVLSIVAETSGKAVVVAVPARHRPLLAEGMAVRLNLVGYPGDSLEVPIARISEDAMTARTIQAAVGEELANMVSATGTYVLIEAELPSAWISLAGQKVQLRHGMRAMAEVRMRSERVIHALIPGFSNEGTNNEQ